MCSDNTPGERMTMAKGNRSWKREASEWAWGQKEGRENTVCQVWGLGAVQLQSRVFQMRVF